MKNKWILIAGLYLTSLVLLCLISLVALQRFSSIEHEEIAEDVQQARSLLASEIDSLLTTAGDYAGWDDTYAFVQNRNQNYILHGLGSSFFSKLRLNLFCIVNLSGEVVYARFRPASTEPDMTLPDDLSPYIAPQAKLFQSVRQLKPLSGLVALEQGLFMVAASPILTTESQGPVQGMLVLGRLLTRDEIDRIGKRAGFALGLLAPDSKESANGRWQFAGRQRDVLPAQVQPYGSDRMRGYRMLSDIDGKPAVLLYLEKTRHIYAEARTIILALALFCAISFGLVAFLFYRTSSQLALVTMQEYASSQQLKSFFELAVDGIMRLDHELRILDASVQAAAVTGYLGDELVGMPFDALFSQEEIDQNPLDRDRLRAGLAVTLHRNLSRKGGVCVPVEVRLKYLPGGSCQCVIQDRTEQAYWEVKLHQQQELLNGIINGTDDIIYAKDLDGRHLLINKTGLRFFNKKREEVLGLGDPQLFPPDTARIISEADQHALCAEGVVVSEDTIPYPSGSETVFLATRAPLVDKQGKVTGLFAILHDVTVRTMLERELLNQHNRLGQLAVSLSLAEEKERVRIAEELHDQVGPTLLSGKMKLNMLQSRLHDEALVAECEAVDGLIVEAVKEIRSLTLQLRPPILANAGLEAALKWLAQEFTQKYDLQVGFADDGQSKPLQYEKRTILFQAVRELLLNVVKHAHCSKAEMAIQRVGSNVRIVVSDSGAGFTNLPDNSGSHASGGFGLFNCTQKLSYIHGRLTIDDTSGAGARVILDAPLDLNQ